MFEFKNIFAMKKNKNNVMIRDLPYFLFYWHVDIFLRNWNVISSFLLDRE